MWLSYDLRMDEEGEPDPTSEYQMLHLVNLPHIVFCVPHHVSNSVSLRPSFLASMNKMYYPAAQSKNLGLTLTPSSSSQSSLAIQPQIASIPKQPDISPTSIGSTICQHQYRPHDQVHRTPAITKLPASPKH